MINLFDLPAPISSIDDQVLPATEIRQSSEQTQTIDENSRIGLSAIPTPDLPILNPESKTISNIPIGKRTNNNLNNVMLALEKYELIFLVTLTFCLFALFLYAHFSLSNEVASFLNKTYIFAISLAGILVTEKLVRTYRMKNIHDINRRIREITLSKALSCSLNGVNDDVFYWAVFAILGAASVVLITGFPSESISIPIKYFLVYFVVLATFEIFTAFSSITFFANIKKLSVFPLMYLSTLLRQ